MSSGLAEVVLGFIRVIVPILVVLDAINAWTAHEAGGYGSLAAALCLFACDVA